MPSARSRPSAASRQRPNNVPQIAQTCRHGPRLFGRALVKIYQYSFASLAGFRCRHLPTCSDYADQAIDRFGLWAGGWMTLARLLRCQPFGTSGLDFVAAVAPPGARWYLPWRYARWRGTNPSPPAP